MSCLTYLTPDGDSDADRIGGDDDGKNDELFVPGLARGPAGSNCQEGRNSGTDTTRHRDDDVRRYDDGYGGDD